MHAVVLLIYRIESFPKIEKNFEIYIGAINVIVPESLQKTMMNDERTVLPCSKRAFSDVLEGVVLTIFSGGKPKDP